MNRKHNNKILSIPLVVFVVAVVICIALPPAPARGLGGYTWTEVTPPVTGNHLFGICSIAEDDVWAVGDGGTIVHYNGFGWSTVSSPTTYTLHSISPAYEEYIWAVGTHGTIIRYSGLGGWNAVSPSPATELLYDVSALASGEAWAVGIEGGIFHCTSAGSWSEVLPKPISRPLRGVAAISWNDVWAVGEGRAYPGLDYATVLHYDGVSWSEYPTTAYGYMLEISAVAANDVWACGSDAMSHALLFHYDGSGWTSYPVEGCTQLWGIDARASDDVWAVGQGGKVMHFDGSTWADVSGGTGSTLYDVVAPGAGVVWGVGESGLIQKGVAATPTITSITPSSAVGGATVLITNLAGTEFTGTPTVKLERDGQADIVATNVTVNSYGTQITCTFSIPTNASIGTWDIYVENHNGEHVIKNNAFTINNPVPTITSLSPISKIAGDSAFTLTLNGTNFVANSKVRWNGIDRTTTYISATELTAAVPGSDVAKAGTASVTVFNAAPGGGVSTNKTFTITDHAPTTGSTWYLAEGTTAWGFSTYITIENPNANIVEANVTYMPTGKANKTEAISLPPGSQTTLTNDRLISLLGQTDFSTRVECADVTKLIAVDRTMTWTGAGATSEEAHSSIGVTSSSKIWYLPEGSTNWGFETWTLVQNPNSQVANVTLTYMTDTGQSIPVAHQVPANSRESFGMASDIGSQDASCMVTSNIPVIPERAMYRNNRREGHDSIGTTFPAQDFYLAEGTSAYGFTTYVLIQNPNAEATDVTVTYMTPTGPKPQAPFTMSPNSRKTIRVNDIPEVAKTDLSTAVHGSLPIIAERAMYWGADKALGEACHDSIGMPLAHKTFYLPDGQSSEGRETWTLVQNPNAEDVQVDITYLTPLGTGNVLKTETIPAGSRRTFNMAEHSGINGRAAIMVTSKTSGKNIMVERAMYWNNRGAGTDTIGGSGD